MVVSLSLVTISWWASGKDQDHGFDNCMRNVRERGGRRKGNNKRDFNK
jgi:hypothetical protein